MSDHFPNARSFRVGDYGNLSNVHRDQYNFNNCFSQTTTGEGSQRKRYMVGTEEEEAHYAEYHDVRRGDIVIKRDLGASEVGRWYFDEEKQRGVWLDCEHRLFTAEVRSEAGKVSSSYTVVSYHGPEREQAWKKDFHQFSGALWVFLVFGTALGSLKETCRSPTNVQVFGYNRSKTPLLLLHNDLVPLAHLLDGVGGLGQVYLRLLTKQLGCMGVELWLDSSRGVLCRGPQGPYCFIRSDIRHGGILNVPSDGKMLQEDLFIRYLATLERSRDIDRMFVEGLSWPLYIPHTSDIRLNRPTVISSLTNATIAVATPGMTPVWANSSCLGGREVLPNGLTRFTLNPRARCLDLECDWSEVVLSWLTWALMVFHTHGISLESDLSKYYLTFARSWSSTLSQSRAKRQRRRKCASVYLFLRPVPMDSIFWSFGEDGHLPISDDLCEYLGLPVRLSFKCREWALPTQTYKAMRDYQIMRGFDPTTSDFARHCGYPSFEAVLQPSLDTTPARFEELYDSESVPGQAATEDRLEDVYMSIPALFGEDVSGLPLVSDSTDNVSFWSGLTSKFSWTASEDLDILAVGF